MTQNSPQQMQQGNPSPVERQADETAYADLIEHLRRPGTHGRTDEGRKRDYAARHQM